MLIYCIRGNFLRPSGAGFTASLSYEGRGRRHLSSEDYFSVTSCAKVFLFLRGIGLRALCITSLPSPPSTHTQKLKTFSTVN